jgi:hypothetical protein
MLLAINYNYLDTPNINYVMKDRYTSFTYVDYTVLEIPVRKLCQIIELD